MNNTIFNLIEKERIESGKNQYSNISIQDALDLLYKRYFVLPSIQRSLDWSMDQIAKLFDSLFNDYPIGAILLLKDKRQLFQTYEFFKDFNKNEDYDNKSDGKLDYIENEDVFFVLDGQQRLTALNIGLRGSYNGHSLYFNINDNTDERKFKFNHKDEQGWGKVSENQSHHNIVSILDKKIGFYCISNTNSDVEKALEIFVRFNSGGKALDKADLLLSTLIFKSSDLNIRDELNSLVKDINKKCGLKINKDFIMKAWITVSTGNPRYEIQKFKNEAKKLLADWSKVKDVISDVSELIGKTFAFNTAEIGKVPFNAMIPIMYYLYIHKIRIDIKDEKFIISLKKWFSVVIINKNFGGSSDQVLRGFIDIIEKDNYKFEINDKFFPYFLTRDKLLLTLKDITYGSEAFSVLSLIHQNLAAGMDMDHIFPKSKFKFKKIHDIGNIHLLSPDKNRTEKKNKMPSIWIEEQKDNDIQEKILREALIGTVYPDGFREIELSKDEIKFDEFLEKRRNIILDKLCNILDINV